MRTIRPLLVAAALAVWFALPAPARAGEPQCPLPLHECLEQYAHMRDRPWLGIWIETDSTTGLRTVQRVVRGGPAERAGVKPGDVLESIGGRVPKDFFAGKAGWSPGEKADLAVNRGGREVKLSLPLEVIPDDTLAELVGAHVLAGHMAYGDFGGAHERGAGREEPH
jgi:predicted metalloprotease with PDZ domain